MTLDDLIKSCPHGVDLGKYLTAHIKGLYRSHIGHMITASDRDNPLQPDAVQWLNEAKQLATEIRTRGIPLDSVDGFLGRLALMNVPREVVLARQMGLASKR